MSKSDIIINIERLEKTVKQNFWQKGYVANCKKQIENYKAMLAKL